MKKIIAGTLISMAIMAGSAFAANQNNTGCGLGTLALGDSEFSNTTLGQVFIVTTNATSGTSTFGITSGTSNCDQPTKFVKSDKAHEFVASNMDNLAKDIAMGQGESLDTLAELMEIPQTERPMIYAELQTNFDTIYPTESVQAAHVLDTVYTIIQ